MKYKVTPNFLKYVKREHTVNHSFQDLVKDVLVNGVEKQNRNGKSLSVFGKSIIIDMKQGFPLMTLRKLPFVSMVAEMLWFLKGRSDLKWLLQNGCTYWVGDAYKKYLSENETNPLSREAFIDEIKNGNDIALLYKYNDLGNIYGKQWVSFGGFFNQIENLLLMLRNDPDNRRMVVSAWNPIDIFVTKSMILPPCHHSFQVWTRELSMEEKIQWVMKNTDVEMENLYITEECFKDSTPKRAISLLWNQRSCDLLLGNDISSYGLLLHILAHEANMIPDKLVANYGDVHIYENQIESAIEIQKRNPNLKLPTLYNHRIYNGYNNSSESSTFNDYEVGDFSIIDYNPEPAMSIPLSN